MASLAALINLYAQAQTQHTDIAGQLGSSLDVGSWGQPVAVQDQGYVGQSSTLRGLGNPLLGIPLSGEQHFGQSAAQTQLLSSLLGALSDQVQVPASDGRGHGLLAIGQHGSSLLGASTGNTSIPGIHHLFGQPAQPTSQSLLSGIAGLSDPATAASLLPFLLQRSQQQPAPSSAPNPIVPRQCAGVQLDTLVGSIVTDDEMLLEALISRKRKQRTVRQALESLHGVNNHTAGSWKDYFLEHCERLMPIVVRHESRDRNAHISDSVPVSVSGTSRPASGNGATRREISTGTAASASKPASHTKASHSRDGNSRRAPSLSGLTSASRSRGTVRGDKRRFVWNRAKGDTVKIPLPPSRSPSPPLHVLMNPDGEGDTDGFEGKEPFTSADDAYMIMSIQWQLQERPRTTKLQMAARLADRCPTHDCDAWLSYILDDRVELIELLTVQAESLRLDSRTPECSSDDEYRHTVSTTPILRTRKQPTRRPPTSVSSTMQRTSNSASTRSQRRTEVYSQGPSQESSEESDLGPDFDEDEQHMGQLCGRYTTADFCIVAKWIISHPELGWDKGETITSRAWAGFGERYSQRSEKAWRAFIRTRREEIDWWVQKYRRRHAQAGVPPKSRSDAHTSSQLSSSSTHAGGGTDTTRHGPREREHVRDRAGVYLGAPSRPRSPSPWIEQRVRTGHLSHWESNSLGSTNLPPYIQAASKSKPMSSIARLSSVSASSVYSSRADTQPESADEEDGSAVKPAHSGESPKAVRAAQKEDPEKGCMFRTMSSSDGLRSVARHRVVTADADGRALAAESDRRDRSTLLISETDGHAVEATHTRDGGHLGKHETLFVDGPSDIALPTVPVRGDTLHNRTVKRQRDEAENELLGGVPGDEDTRVSKRARSL